MAQKRMKPRFVQSWFLWKRWKAALVSGIAFRSRSGGIVLRIFLLDNVCNVLSDNDPIGCKRFRVSFARSCTDIVLIELSKQVESASEPRRKGGLCEEEVGFYSIYHLVTGLGALLVV